MKLHETIPYSLKQLLRTPLKLVLYFALPLLAAAFLCLGLNLYQYASDNLDAVYNAFDIVAVPSFKGNINSSGEICDDINDPDYIGLFSCEAKDYDLSALTALDGVVSYDIRNQFGAYVSNGGAKLCRAAHKWNVYENDMASVVCFSTAISEPSICNANSGVKFPAHIKWAAANQSDSPASVVKTFGMVNNTEQTFILEPGKDYIALLNRWDGLGTDIYHLKDYSEDPEAGSFFMSRRRVNTYTGKRALLPSWRHLMSFPLWMFRFRHWWNIMMAFGRRSRGTISARRQKRWSIPAMP